jgi:hypothetical protein
MFCPEHANICGKAGWVKKAVREYVHQHCRMSARRLLNKVRCTPDKVRPQWQWLMQLSEWEQEQTMVPVVQSANNFEIMVLGGPVGKDMIFRTIASPSTALITDRGRCYPSYRSVPVTTCARRNGAAACPPCGTPVGRRTSRRNGRCSASTTFNP